MVVLDRRRQSAVPRETTSRLPSTFPVVSSSPGPTHTSDGSERSQTSSIPGVRLHTLVHAPRQHPRRIMGGVGGGGSQMTALEHFLNISVNSGTVNYKIN